MRKTPHGIPLIGEKIHEKLFSEEEYVGKGMVLKSRYHLETHNLLPEQSEGVAEVDIELPDLNGETLREHFYNCATDVAGYYQSIAEKMVHVDIPEMPKEWVIQVGWTRYEPGKRPESVKYPLEDGLVFDVEVTVLHSNYPTIACAVSSEAWYLWVSSQLFGGSNPLCPLGTGKKLVIAHNASYDRARVKEEYDTKQNDIRFLDTFSLHMAVGGISSKQRPLYLKYLKAKETGEEMAYTPEWLLDGSMNSLADLVKLYIGENLSKDARDTFVRGTLSQVKANFQELAQYNALDVLKTWQVYKVLYPRFKRKCPSPVTFAGMITMQKAILHTNFNKWNGFVRQCNEEFSKQKNRVESGLKELAVETVERWKNGEPLEKDPWLKNLDWGVKPRVKTLKGYPNWYRDLWDSKLKDIKITTRTVVTPYLLRLAWMGYPLKRIFEFGWGYVVPVTDLDGEKGFEGIYLDVEGNYQKEVIFVEKGREPDRLGMLRTTYAEEEVMVSTLTHQKPPEWAVEVFYRIPHKDGDKANCGNPLAKDYLKSMEDGVLASETGLAREVLDSAISCSYWVSIKERVEKQFVVDAGQGVAVIIPQLLVSGTVTRRAVENLWLTASSAKKNRIGSEIKTLVIAPAGFKYVGADVTAEEAWLFALLGDSYWGFHGSTAVGVQVLTGSKENGTDIHSMTAKVLGCNRDSAKQINYARYYGSGLAATSMYIKQSNKELTDHEAKNLAKKIFSVTKGKKVAGKWEGGTESYSFNEMEKIATSSDPRTPALGCGISEALHPSKVGKDYMTSRVNWCIQSSGVDFLHMVLTGVEYLCGVYGIKARLMLTIHDEIRYLVKEEDAYRFALALQVAHLWTRAAISEAVGIYDLPQCVAWFDEVDIDHVLRKDPTSPCITPSQPVPIPPGQVVTIYDIVEATGGSLKP